MQKFEAWLVVILALGSISPTFSQNASNSAEITKSGHTIVPLTSNSLDGRLSGDPDKPGAQYVIRIQNDTNQVVLPHWHPEDEHVVVVKGTWFVGMGDRFDRNALRELHVGDYALVPRRMHHFAWSKTETIIQVHGIGPFQIIPVDSWEFLGGGKLTPENAMVKDSEPVSSFRFRISDRVRSKRGEGLIVAGLRSKENKVTEYDVQTDDGQRFFESDEELTRVAQSKNLESGPLTGTWVGIMRGLAKGDTTCTFYVHQHEDRVVGVLALPQGGAAFSSSTFYNNALQIHLDTPVGKFLFQAEYKRGALSGEWSVDGGPKGTWEAKKIVEAAKQ